MEGYSSKDRNEVGDVIGSLVIAGVFATVASPVALLAGAAALAGIGQSLWNNSKGDGVANGKTNRYDVEMQKLKIQEVKDRMVMNKELHQQKMEQLKAAKKEEKFEAKGAKEEKFEAKSATPGAQAMAYVRATNRPTESARTGGASSAKSQSDYHAYKQDTQKGVADQLKSDQKSRGQATAAEFKSQMNARSSAQSVKPALDKAKEAGRSGLAQQTAKASTGVTPAKTKDAAGKAASKVADSGRALSRAGVRTAEVGQKAVSATSDGVKNAASKVASVGRK